MLLRCVTNTFDCWMRTPKQSSQVCVCWKLRKTMYGSLQPNGEKSITLMS